MVDMYVELIHKFPFVIALIDPLRKEVRDHRAVLEKLIIPLSDTSMNFSHFYKHIKYKASVFRDLSTKISLLKCV